MPANQTASGGYVSSEMAGGGEQLVMKEKADVCPVDSWLLFMGLRSIDRGFYDPVLCHVKPVRPVDFAAGTLFRRDVGQMKKGGAVRPAGER